MISLIIIVIPQKNDKIAFTLNCDHNHVLFFLRCTAANISIITKIFKNDMVIPEFDDFLGMIQVIYSKCQKNNKGAVCMHLVY